MACCMLLLLLSIEPGESSRESSRGPLKRRLLGTREPAGQGCDSALRHCSARFRQRGQGFGLVVGGKGLLGLSGLGCRLGARLIATIRVIKINPAGWVTPSCSAIMQRGKHCTLANKASNDATHLRNGSHAHNAHGTSNAASFIHSFIHSFVCLLASWNSVDRRRR